MLLAALRADFGALDPKCHASRMNHLTGIGQPVLEAMYSQCGTSSWKQGRLHSYTLQLYTPTFYPQEPLSKISKDPRPRVLRPPQKIKTGVGRWRPQVLRGMRTAGGGHGERK